MPISKVFGKLYKVEKDGFYSIKNEIEISNKIKKYLIFLRKKWYLKKIKYNLYMVNYKEKYLKYIKYKRNIGDSYSDNEIVDLSNLLDLNFNLSNETNSELNNKYDELKKLQRIRNSFISEYPINKNEWEKKIEYEIDLGLEYEDDITKEDINDIKINYEKDPIKFIKKHNLSINKLKMYIRSILTKNI